MPRRMTPSQIRSRLNQAQAKQRQAVNKYVRDVNRAIDRYNSEVRAYNSRRRLHQQQVRREFARLTSSPSTLYVSLHTSVTRLHSVYTVLEGTTTDRTLTPQENLLYDLSERETANSLDVVNTLLSPAELSQTDTSPTLQQTSIEDELAVISEDFDRRWRGALHALSPSNPDAARHFCASVREIFTGVIDLKAPDSAVESLNPECQRTPEGTPTRRSKIHFLLQQREIANDALTDFFSEDIENILELFEVLNSGTHGESGRYDLQALRAIKQRVEDGILFLSRITV